MPAQPVTAYEIVSADDWPARDPRSWTLWGRPAPRLVTAAAVEGMKSGSVVVDLAGETGGNCELTEPGQTVVKHGVTIASPLNLPATMPEHASELYSKNITALLDLLITDGALAPDFDDEVIAGACVTREGN